MRKLTLAMLVSLLIALMGPGSFASADESGGADQIVRETGPGSWEGRVRKAVDRRSHERKQATHKTGSQLRKGSTPKPHKLSKRELAAIEAMCREAPGGVCTDEPTKKTKLTPLKLVGSLSQVARTLIVKLHLPDPTPRIGPDPTTNEWKMAAVGYPLWLWTDGPTTITSRTRAYGITFTLRADWRSTTFDMGDGHHHTCTHTPAYPKTTKPGTKSPSCGYTYLTASLPKGTYTVTATTNWNITWHALGQTGTIPGSHAGQWTLPVGELNALVVK